MLPGSILILAASVPGSIHRWKVLGWSIGEEYPVSSNRQVLLIHSSVLGRGKGNPCGLPWRFTLTESGTDSADGAGVDEGVLSEAALLAIGEALPPREGSAT